jgi:hypothetical protein
MIFTFMHIMYFDQIHPVYTTYLYPLLPCLKAAVSELHYAIFITYT